MKQLIVDCGATKTDWGIVEEGRVVRNVRTPGFNLMQTPEETLKAILDQASAEIGPGIGEVHFYAAGLVGESPVDLGRWFPGASVEYASDMLGAARAVCGHNPGVAAILGTGANTCEFDGKDIVWKVNCGGFILGDEGSGAVLGKLFITDYLKGYMPKELYDEFQEQYHLDYITVVKSVYGAQAPARFLGSFAPFVLAHCEKSEYALGLVESNFRNLFERTLSQYRKDLPVGVVGGFGYACKDILSRLGKEYGVTFTRFMSTPNEGLAEYHAL